MRARIWRVGWKPFSRGASTICLLLAALIGVTAGRGLALRLPPAVFRLAVAEGIGAGTLADVWQSIPDAEVRDAVGWIIFRLTGVHPFDPPAFLTAAFPFLPTPAAPEVVPRPVPGFAVLGRPTLVGIYETYTTQSFRFAVGPGRRAYSSDPRLNVAAVGMALARDLNRLGIGVLYSNRINDPDGLIGAYLNSADLVRSMLRSDPELRFLIDVHRGTGDDRETTTSGPLPPEARVTIVVGTGRLLPDPRWVENYRTAQRLLAALERIRPGLRVGLRLSPDRLNQELSPGALQVDIGGPDNTLAEEDRAAADIAAALAAVLREGR